MPFPSRTNVNMNHAIPAVRANTTTTRQCTNSAQQCALRNTREFNVGRFATQVKGMLCATGATIAVA
jgi:hypothetical protein